MNNFIETTYIIESLWISSFYSASTSTLYNKDNRSVFVLNICNTKKVLTRLSEPPQACKSHQHQNEGQTNSSCLYSKIQKDVLIMRHWISFHGDHVRLPPETHRERPLHHYAMSLDQITSFLEPRKILHTAGSHRWTCKLFTIHWTEV